MKERVPIGHSPLDRDWDLARARNRAQKQRRLNIVVVRDGYQSGELQTIFNLTPFVIEREVRRQGRRPITGLIVQLVPVHIAAIAFAVSEDGAKQPVLGSHVRQEIKALFGHAGMAMQRNPGGKISRCVSRKPGIGDA